MKNIKLILVFFVAFQFNGNAQVKLDDFGRIVLNTYLPEQSESMPDQAKSLLENKLSQIASSNGMGGSAINPRFVIMANSAIITKDIVAGPPQMLSYNIEVTFYIADAIDMKKFANTTIELKGVGTNENKAYIDAIKNINIKNKDIVTFIQEGKSKIVDFYNTQCDFIIKDAESYSKKGEYDAAMLKLAAVPEVCEKCYITCMDKMNEVYQQKIDKECLLIMREANNAWMANSNVNGAEQVAEILNRISPFSTCEPDAGNLMKKIENKLASVEKAKWDLKIKKYNDAIKLKELAIRTDAEDRKRQAHLQDEDRKRQAYLQKEEQKQDYALRKADQEAGGFRGFVNSIVKLKMTLWRDNSNDYINNKPKLDYSKIK
jgi:hypothetical protein